MNDKDRVDQTEVHSVNRGKPDGVPAADTERKGRKASDAAKEASRTDDTVV